MTFSPFVRKICSSFRREYFLRPVKEPNAGSTIRFWKFESMQYAPVSLLFLSVNIQDEYGRRNKEL